MSAAAAGLFLLCCATPAVAHSMAACTPEGEALERRSARHMLSLPAMGLLISGIAGATRSIGALLYEEIPWALSYVSLGYSGGCIHWERKSRSPRTEQWC